MGPMGLLERFHRTQARTSSSPLRLRVAQYPSRRCRKLGPVEVGASPELIAAPPVSLATDHHLVVRIVTGLGSESASLELDQPAPDSIAA